MVNSSMSACTPSSQTDARVASNTEDMPDDMMSVSYLKYINTFALHNGGSINDEDDGLSCGPTYEAVQELPCHKMIDTSDAVDGKALT